MRPRRSGSAEGSCGPGHPSAAQALKLTDGAACLGEALCGVPTERNPSTHLYPGLHPGLVCSAPLGHPDESSTALSRLGGATPMCRQRPYLGLVGQPQWIVDGFISAWWGNPLESSMALSWLVEALLSAAWGQAVCAGWAGFGDRLLGGTGCWEGQAAGRDRLLGIGRPFVEITSAGTSCSPEIALCCGRCGVAS